MKSSPTKSLNFMNFARRFHETMLEHNLQLVYEGEVNQSVTKAFAALTEKSMNDANIDMTTMKRVYHIMVESLQNISKHADDLVTGKSKRPGSGIFIVGKSDSTYVITTGNVINNQRVSKIRNLIDKVNALNEDEIKELYKKQMREARLSDKGGAGLGFIDMVKKTGNKLEYHFEKINDLTSFFILKSSIGIQQKSNNNI